MGEIAHYKNPLLIIINIIIIICVCVARGGGVGLSHDRQQILEAVEIKQRWEKTNEGTLLVT